MSGSQNLLIARPVAPPPGNALMARPQRAVGVAMPPQGLPPGAIPPQGMPQGRPMPLPQAMPPQGMPSGPPPGPPPGAAPQAPPPQLSRQAAFAQKAVGLQLPPDQLALHLKAGDALIANLAPLVRGKKDPTIKDTVKAIGNVLDAAPGAFPVQAAVKFLNSVPDDPDKVRDFLTDRLHDAIASRIHLAGIAQQMAGPPPGTPPMDGPPPGAMPPQAPPPGAP